MLGFSWVVLLSGQKEHAGKCPRFRALHTGPQKGVRSTGGVNCAEAVKFTWEEPGLSRFFDKYSPRRSEWFAKSLSLPEWRISQSVPLGNSSTANRMRSGEPLRYDKVLGVTLD